MHDPYGQCAKFGLFRAPFLFSGFCLLSLGGIFRQPLLLRKESNTQKSQ